MLKIDFSVDLPKLKAPAEFDRRPVYSAEMLKNVL